MPGERMTKKQLRALAVSAYLPTTVTMIGHGAVLPLIPLTARDLGASVAEAAFVVALVGIGVLVGTLPGGILAERIGEKRALVAACLVDAVAMALGHVAPNIAVLGLASFVIGTANAIFGVARQGYLTLAVPGEYRARAMSTLGGVFRLGSFIGPLVGAAVVATWDLRAAYLLAIFTSLVAAGITIPLPDLPSDKAKAAHESTRMWTILTRHRHVYLTLGLGAAALMLVRAARDAIIPLWCDSAGLHPAETSLIAGIGSGVDMLLFYLGGSLMDRHGRRFVAVPSMIIMGTCYALLPLTHSFPTIMLIAIGLGLGNGISSGVVLTLGADAAPRASLSRFLAGWRLTSSLGQAAGPIVITAVAAAVSLTGSAWFVALVGWLGGAWLWKWIPSPAPTPAAPPRDAEPPTPAAPSASD